jgi:uncharacterized membrane protein YhaH (DUF805 family)
MTNWYYATGNDREGPVEADEIDRLIGAGQIASDTLVWREGLDGWEPAMRHFSFAARSAPPPPPPPVSDTPSSLRPSEPSYSGGSSSFAGDGAASSASTQLGPDGLYVGAPGRGFGEAISTCFSKYVTFSGRASRSEYWFFVLFLVLGGIAATIIDAIIFPGSLTSESGGPFNAIFSLATLLPSLAVSWRRLHDLDRSGWWIGGFYLAMIVVVVVAVAIASSSGEDAVFAVIGVIAIAALIYGIVLLVWFCQRGTPGPNRFG